MVVYKTKILLLWRRWPWPILAFQFGPLVLLLQNTFKLFGFPIFRYWADLIIWLSNISILRRFCGSPVWALGFIASKHFLIICLSNISTLSVPGEGCYRNSSCAVNLISTVLLYHNTFVFRCFNTDSTFPLFLYIYNTCLKMSHVRSQFWTLSHFLNSQTNAVYNWVPCYSYVLPHQMHYIHV